MKVTLIKRDQTDKVRWVVELDDDELQELLTATVFAVRMRSGRTGEVLLAAMTVTALCDKEACDSDVIGRLAAKELESGVTRFIVQSTRVIRENQTEKGQS